MSANVAQYFLYVEVRSNHAGAFALVDILEADVCLVLCRNHFRVDG